MIFPAASAGAPQKAKTRTPLHNFVKWRPAAESFMTLAFQQIVNVRANLAVVAVPLVKPRTVNLPARSARLTVVSRQPLMNRFVCVRQELIGTEMRGSGDFAGGEC